MSIKNRIKMSKEEPNNGGDSGDGKIEWQWRRPKGIRGHTESPQYNKKRCTKK